MTTQTTTYYTVRNGGIIEMRQTRFRQQYERGKDHPHDVCAVGRSNEEIAGMVERYSLGSVDYSLTSKSESERE